MRGSLLLLGSSSGTSYIGRPIPVRMLGALGSILMVRHCVGRGRSCGGLAIERDGRDLGRGGGRGRWGH